MSTLITIILVVLGIMLSILLHEFGHFIPARLFKVPCPQFFIGFGPKLWSKKWKGTEWSIKPFWLGGATEISGMVPGPKPQWNQKEYKQKGVDKYGNPKFGPIATLIIQTREESISTLVEGQEDKAFYWLSTPKKILVMAGGILMNLLLAIIFLTLAFSVVGGSAPSNYVQAPNGCVSNTNVCGANDPVSPVKDIGLKDGSKIVSINNVKISSWQDIITQMDNVKQGQTLKLGFENNDITQIKIIKPYFVEGKAKLGISSSYQNVKMSFTEIPGLIWTYFSGTVQAIISIPIGLFNAIKAIFGFGDRGDNALISIVGMGEIAVAGVNNSDSFSQAAFTMLSLLGSLNIALFTFNLFPLLPLDGGHVVNAIYEGIRRQWAKMRKKERPNPADLARSMPIGYIVFMLLLLMGVILIIADIVHPIV